MSERILKWNVPVDDHEHAIGWGDVVHVASQSDPDVVQIWTMEKFDDDNVMVEPERTVRIIGTGHPLPDPAEYLGTALASNGGVRHVIAVGSGTELGPDSPDFYSTSEITPYGTVVAYIVPNDDADEDHTLHDIAKITRGGVDHMIWMLSTGIEETA